jgi:hypothetical protein
LVGELENMMKVKVNIGLLEIQKDHHLVKEVIIILLEEVIKMLWNQIY